MIEKYFNLIFNFYIDLDACVWLEEELKTYSRILVIISHSQDFMNGVCNNIIHLDKQKLKYYGGNYDAFVRTRLELLENQAKRYNWEQSQISHMKVHIQFINLIIYHSKGMMKLKGRITALKSVY